MYNHSYQHQTHHNFYSMGDKPHTQFCDISLIHKNIYLGDKTIALNKTQLKKHNIRHILVVGDQLETKFQGEFNYLKIPIKDNVKQDIMEILQKTNQWIDQNVSKKQNILIHCAFGVSRSASIVIGYMIYKFKMSYEQSFHFVKQRRSQIMPNEGFRQQLKKFSFQRNKK